MSDDVVVPFPKQYNPPSTPDPRRGEKAEKAREHAIRREEMARERKQRSDRLMACPKADPSIRVAVAKRLGELYATVKHSVGTRGVIGKVFSEAGLQNEKTDSSKRRVRYVVLPGETPNPKLLSSNLQKYQRLADALARTLGRDPDEVFLEVFRGIFPDESPVRESVDQEIYDNVSFVLNTICAGIIQKHNLQAAFKLTSRWALGIGADNQWAPTVPILQFGSDSMSLDHWIHDADCGCIANMIPSVKLSGYNYSIAASATLRGVSVSRQDSHAPDSIVDWTAIARAHGMAPVEIQVKHNVYLVILPGTSSAPIAALLERYDIDPLIGDERPYYFQSNENNWYTFRSLLPNGTEEINALQIGDSRIASVDQPRVRQDIKKFIDHEGRFRIRKVTPSTLMDLYEHFDCELVDFGFESGSGYSDIAIWHGTHGTFEDSRSIPEDLPSYSPSRSMAAVIERNISHAPIDARLDVLLENQVLQFKSKLGTYIATRRQSFAEATKPILEHWLDQASSPAPQAER